MSVTLNSLAMIDNTTFIEIHLTAWGDWKIRVTMLLQFFIYININFISSNKSKIQEKQNYLDKSEIIQNNLYIITYGCC